MNKSLLKFLTDFGPLLIFFYFYKNSGNTLGVAIPPLIISTVIAVIIVYLVERKIPYIPLIGAVLISFFGGLTVPYATSFVFDLKKSRTQKPVIMIPGSIPISLVVFIHLS